MYLPSQKSGTWLSTNEALLAHMHPLMIDAFGVSLTEPVGAHVPVNLRGKVHGVEAGMMGNNITVVQCIYDAHADKTEHLAARIHNEMRAKVSESALLQSLRFANSTFGNGEFYECKHSKKSA